MSSSDLHEKEQKGMQIGEYTYRVFDKVLQYRTKDGRWVDDDTLTVAEIYQFAELVGHPADRLRDVAVDLLAEIDAPFYYQRDIPGLMRDLRGAIKAYDALAETSNAV